MSRRDEEDVGVNFDDCRVKVETDRALCVQGDSLKRFYKKDQDGLWVPKSNIHDDSEVFKTGDEGTLVIKSWWAEKEGLG